MGNFKFMVNKKLAIVHNECVLLQVLNGIVYLVSLMGNRGTFTKSLHGIITDLEFIYHMGYLVISMMGMCVHEFFYSLLVSTTLF